MPLPVIPPLLIAAASTEGASTLAYILLSAGVFTAGYKMGEASATPTPPETTDSATTTDLIPEKVTDDVEKSLNPLLEENKKIQQTLKAEAKHFKKEIQKTEKTIKNLKTKIKGLDQTNKTANATIKSLSKEMGTLKNRNDKLHLDLRRVTSELAAREEKLSEVTLEFESSLALWQKNQKQYQDEMTELRSTLKKLKREIKQVPAQKKRIKALEETLRETTQKHDEAIKIARAYAEAFYVVREELNQSSANTNGERNHATRHTCG